MKSIIITFTLFSLCTGVYAGDKDIESKGLKIEVQEIAAPTCPEKADGFIEIKVQGGVAPYEYNWNTFPNQYTSKAKGLKSGTYFVQIKDATGAVHFTSVEIPPCQFKEKEKWTASNFAVVNKDNFDVENCELYNYILNGEKLSWNDLLQKDAGIYTVTVCTEDKCIVQSNIQIVEYSAKKD